MVKIKKYMDKFKFLVFAFLLTVAVSCGQQKRYISYKVQKGETMRDIAKRLDMKTRDLLRLNPDVGRKPKENTMIIIPNPKSKNVQIAEKIEAEKNPTEEKDVVSETVTTPEKTDTQIEKVTTEYETHTVQAGETVWALTKKYGISKDDLVRLNPTISDLKNNKLSIGQVLNVKAIIKKTYVSLEEELKDFVTHEVQPKETMYSLTRFYNIPKEKLVALNGHLPNLKDNLLSVGDILKIRPVGERKENSAAKVYVDSINTDKKINLAILLPFKAREYDSVRAVDIFKGKKGRVANMVTDFYMGAEIAIDSIKKQGVDVNVKVFDTGNRGKNTSTIVAENNLNDEDVIIGPFYSNQVKNVTSRVKIPVVFPHFSKKQKDLSSSKLIKTAPELNEYAHTLASYLKSNYNGETIFVVGDGKSHSNSLVNILVSSLKKHDSIKDINVLKPENGYIKKSRFTSKMTPKSRSWVIMTSDNYVSVSDALNSMIVLPDGVNAKVFAVHKNNAYNKIDNNKLAKIGFTYVTHEHINDNDALTKIFNRKYEAKNHSFPSEYATKGFDVTYDILIRLASGNSLNKTFKQGTSIRVANKFKYDTKLFGSTSNKGLFIVKYNKDLSVDRVW